MKRIDVSTKQFPNYFAIVDDEDYEQISAFKWSATKPQNIIYAVRGVVVDGKKTSIRMHRQIMPGFDEIDHRDGDGLNNRRENLRPCNTKQNQQNRKRSRGSSKYKGVSWHKHEKKWRSTIVIDGKQTSLGYFVDEHAAALAYDTAAVLAFGEFASINGSAPA